jgi:hypothetical protein
MGSAAPERAARSTVVDYPHAGDESLTEGECGRQCRLGQSKDSIALIKCAQEYVLAIDIESMSASGYVQGVADDFGTTELVRGYAIGSNELQGSRLAIHPEVAVERCDVEILVVASDARQRRRRFLDDLEHGKIRFAISGQDKQLSLNRGEIDPVLIVQKPKKTKIANATEFYQKNLRCLGWTCSRCIRSVHSE